MDQVGLLALMGIAIGVVYIAGRDGARATQTAFEGYFRGYRPDPWPQGVQEQDIERHWDAGRPSGRRRKSAPTVEADDPYVWVEQEHAEVRTLMRPPAIRIQPIRDYQFQSHI
jgi:hypothetical protein